MSAIQKTNSVNDQGDGPSWQAELTFRDWKNELEGARANWAGAPAMLKTTLLLQGVELGTATSWMLTRPRDLTPQQQSFIRKSIARSYNAVATDQRHRDVRMKGGLKWVISFGATVSAFVLFFAAWLLLYALWIRNADFARSGSVVVSAQPPLSRAHNPEANAEIPDEAVLPVPAWPSGAPAARLAAPALPQRPTERELAAKATAASGDAVLAQLLALEALSQTDLNAPIPPDLIPAVTILQATQVQHRSRVRPSSSAAAGILASQDGVDVALTATDDAVSVWAAGAGTPVAILNGHEAAITAVAFSRDQRLAATASWDETVRIWDARTRRNLKILRGHDGTIATLAFSDDGRRLATAGEGRTARIWDIATGSQQLVLRGHLSTIESVAFAQAGDRLLSTSLDGTARLWDTATGREIATLDGGSGAVSSARFSATSRRIVGMTRDGALPVWSAEDGKLLMADAGAQAGVSRPIRSFAMGGSTDVLLVVGADGTTATLDSTTGVAIATFAAPGQDRIVTAGFSADGRHIEATTAQRQVMTWPVHASLRQLVDHVRHALPRCLSANERADLGLDVASPAWCRGKTDTIQN